VTESESSGDGVYAEVIEAIEAWDPESDGLDWDDATFDALARRVFRYQWESDERYRDFCERRGRGPSSIESYRDIPAVATEVFKHVDLGSTDDPVRTFRTSGTTTGVRGRHAFETLRAYRTSLHPPFVRFCNPERSSIRMLVCAPPPEVLPESSLSFMLGELVDRWGDSGSAFFADGGEGSTARMEFDFDGFAGALDRAERDGVQTMVLGTAFGLAAFFDCRNGSWELPGGSRLMETGGFKGRFENVTKDEFYGECVDRLGVDRGRCVAEYGMTELSSQAYTSNLADGSDPRPSERPFVAPPWARIEVVDPATMERLDCAGARGLVRWYDLANVGSVCAVQTSDLGEVAPGAGNGVFYIGRAEGASLRGCSLTAEEIASRSEP